jgi:hypothetical protein
MTVTWGSMKTRADLDKGLARAFDKTMALEQECYEQAKAELNGHHHTGLAWVRAVMARAQQIKEEKRAAKK